MSNDNFLNDWLSKPREDKNPNFQIGDIVVYKSEESDFNCGHILNLGGKELLIGTRGDQGCPKTSYVKVEDILGNWKEEKMIGRTRS